MSTTDAGSETGPAGDPDALFSHWRMMKRVLVATDGSLTAADATSFAVDFASQREAELIFVHVVPTIDFVAPVGLDDTRTAFPHEPTTHDHGLLRKASAVATEHGVKATTVLLSGATADEIVAHAEACDADLIVIGSRGHGPIASALLGSVALGVLHASRKPVLVVRCAQPPHPAAAAADPV